MEDYRDLMRRGYIASVRISVLVVKTLKQHFMCFAFYSAQNLNNGMYENLQKFRRTVEICSASNEEAADIALRSAAVKEGLNWLRGEIRNEEKQQRKGKRTKKWINQNFSVVIDAMRLKFFFWQNQRKTQKCKRILNQNEINRNKFHFQAVENNVFSFQIDFLLTFSI